MEKEINKNRYFHQEFNNDWRSWGSWFSWGSPIGLSLGFGIFLSSIGFFLLLLRMAGLLGR